MLAYILFFFIIQTHSNCFDTLNVHYITVKCNDTDS